MLPCDRTTALIYGAGQIPSGPVVEHEIERIGHTRSTLTSRSGSTAGYSSGTRHGIGSTFAYVTFPPRR
jgi:hypothetical protein